MASSTYNSNLTFEEVVKESLADYDVTPTDATTDDCPRVPSSTPLLPPCRVCGERSSGFHYGANTCEACKGFFRRSLKRRKDYVCIGEGACEMSLQKRASCSYCRLKKCEAMGMSKDAIKTGRYTHEKRTSDIREIKQLQKIAKLAPAVIKSVVFPEADLDALISEMIQTHRVNSPHNPEFFAALPTLEEKFLEEQKLHFETFGMMKSISREEYMQIFNSTGLDIDGRQEKLQAMFTAIEESIRRFIVFVKTVPKFKLLSRDDQVSLVKEGRGEVWLVWHHPAFNLDKGLFTTPFGEVLWLEWTKTWAYCMDLYEFKLTCVRRLQHLHLTYEETVILGCIIFMSSDKVKLENPEIVNESQEMLAAALELLLRRSHPDNHQMVLAWCCSVCTELRTIRDLSLVEEEKFHNDWKDKLDIPPLVYEIWGS